MQESLESFFNKNKEVAVAFSGGCDSCLLLALAHKFCKRVKAYMVFTPFQRRTDLTDAKTFAQGLGVDLEVIKLDVLKSPQLQNNPELRCYYCKSIMFDTIRKAMKQDNFDILLDGTNLSDDPANRPGFKALDEHNVLSPLRLCGLYKEDVRALSAKMGLSSANKPSFPCVATKIPFNTPLSDMLLRETEKHLFG